MWMFVQGGMTPLEAIRAATFNGAHYLGMDKDLGSIEPGKCADLIVLDKNPLENIQNTEFVRTVVVNGRVYDAETMNEIGTRERRRFQFYFSKDIGGSMIGEARHGCICGAGH
jgi:adenine deaminase